MTNNSLTLPPNSLAPGARLHCKVWLPGGAPKAIVLLVHGYAEHLGRYEHVAARLNRSGYGVYAVDHWGHGNSDGVPGFVPAFSVYLDGVAALLERVKAAHPGVPRILLGHSMGGLIAAAFLLRWQQEFAGAVLSGPAIKASQEPPALTIAIAKLLSRIAPRLGVLQLDGSLVSRDPKVVADYLADPLVYKGKVGARLGAEMFAAMHEVQAQAASITLPILLLHGAQDGLAAPAGSEFLHQHVGSTDKTLKIYPGLYHEIFNEPEQQMVLGDVVAWMDRHVAT
jgi:alpha-beta hydrolase superfamily lysophospholipase